MNDQRQVPAALTARTKNSASVTGGTEGLRIGPDGWGNSRPPPGFDRRNVQTVVSRYTD